MRCFYEAPAAAVAVLKAPQLIDDRRTATKTRRAPGPIKAWGIR